MPGNKPLLSIKLAWVCTAFVFINQTISESILEFYDFSGRCICTSTGCIIYLRACPSTHPSVSTPARIQINMGLCIFMSFTILKTFSLLLWHQLWETTASANALMTGNRAQCIIDRNQGRKAEQTDGGVKKGSIYAKFEKNKGIKGMSQTRWFKNGISSEEGIFLL